MPQPRRTPPVVVHRWVQMVLLPMAVLAAYALMRAASHAVGIFVVAAVIALILNPLVGLVHRGRMPRGLAVAIVYLSFLSAVALAGVLLANPVSDQARQFGEDVPSIVDSANESLADLQTYFDDNGINVEVKAQGQTALETLSDKVVGGTSEVVSLGTEFVERAIRAGFSLVLIIVVSIYMLFYAPRIGELVRRIVPAGDGSPEDDYPRRVQRAVFGYVRGQFFFSLAMGTGAAVCLYIYGLLGIFPEGKTYAVAFGIFFGAMELVPFIGPVLGAAPPVIVALFTDPLTAVWVALLFLAIQQIEGHIVAPLIFGHTLRINPLLVIFSLLFGGEIYGIIGALVALPIAAVARETYDYLSERVTFARWTEPVTETSQIASRE